MSGNGNSAKTVAGLTKRLSAELPEDVMATLEAQIEGKPEEEQVAILRHAASRVDEYLAIVTSADRLKQVQPDIVNVQVNGRTRVTVPFKWDVMTHLALAHGWRQVGDLYLENVHVTGTPRRIDLVVTYSVGEARARPRIRGTGELDEYLADGEIASAPTADLNELYRWLESRGYKPSEFQWLQRTGVDKRQRRQTYVLEGNPTPPGELLPNRQKRPKGWQYMKTCQTCPMLATCPDVAAPCEIKAEAGRKDQARFDRLPTYSGYA